MLQLPTAATSGDSSSLPVVVSGGQAGVFYYFRTTAEGAEWPLPAYFHQRDRQHGQDTEYNKGLGQLRMDIDFAVAADHKDASVLSAALAITPPAGPIVEMTGITAESTLFVRAQKAQTGVDIAMAAPPVIETSAG